MIYDTKIGAARARKVVGGGNVSVISYALIKHTFSTLAANIAFVIEKRNFGVEATHLGLPALRL